MGGADSAKLSELINGQAWTASVGPAILEISKSIISTLKSISPERIGELKTLRLNWMRIETALTSASSPVPLPRVKEVVDRFVLAINHARFVSKILNLRRKRINLFKMLFIDLDMLMISMDCWRKLDV